MALVERQLEEITWDKPGTVVTGHLLRAQKVKYADGGVGTKYLIRNLQKKLVAFFGSARLDALLQRDDIGRLIEVTFVGADATREPKPGFSPAKIFRVAVDDSAAVPTDDPSDPGITDDDIPF